MKKLITITILLLAFNINAQEQRGSIMIGNKTFELSYLNENEEGLGFGVSASIAHSNPLEARANKNDSAKNIHEFTNKITPAVFGLISADFEEVTIIGKLGASYVNQKINGIQDSKKYYFAVGIAVEVPVYEDIAVKASFDSVNSLMVGVNFKL